MTIDFTRKHVTIAIVTIVFIIGAFIGSYYFIIKKDEQVLAKKAAELDNLEQQLTIIEKNLANIKDRIDVSSTEIQREVPVQPLVDQLLLHIDRAEFLSKVSVSQLSVGSTAEEVPFPSEQPEEREKRDSTAKIEEKYDLEKQLEAESTEMEETDEDSEREDFEADDGFLPRGMKMVRVNISAEANNFFEMEKFIDVLHKLQRIIRIDNISFTGQQEIVRLETEEQKIPFQLSLTTFYYPKLLELIEDLPQLDTPNQANKLNPFVGFSQAELEALKKRQEEQAKVAEDEQSMGDGQNNDEDYSDQNNDNNMTNDEDDPQKLPNQNKPDSPKDDEATKIVKHTVVKNENLFRISLRYYGANAMIGIEKIKQANNLTSNLIYPGQVLTIP